MENQTTTTALGKGPLNAIQRTNRLDERIQRIHACLKRDKGNEKKVAALTEELEAREAELTFTKFKAK